MIKKVVFLMIVSFVFVVSLEKVHASDSAMFSDVDKSHWGYEDMLFLKGEGIVEAVEGNIYQPDEIITRSKSARMLVKALGVSTSAPTVNYPDLANDHPDYSYIKKATELGIFEGFEDGTFRPEEELTRAQMAKVLVETFELTGVYPKEFKDVRTNHWAEGYISSLAASQVTIGVGNDHFSPETETTRAQMATFITRAIKGSPFDDENIGQYTNITHDWKIKNGMMYTKIWGTEDFLIPSEKVTSNIMLMNMVKTLLDKDRYLYVDHGEDSRHQGGAPERLGITLGETYRDLDIGERLRYVFFINDTATYEYEGIENIRVTFGLDFTWYDVYEDKLQDSLQTLVGNDRGSDVYEYIVDLHDKYQDSDKRPTMHEPSKDYEISFGSLKLAIAIGHQRMYIRFI